MTPPLLAISPSLHAPTLQARLFRIMLSSSKVWTMVGFQLNIRSLKTRGFHPPRSSIANVPMIGPKLFFRDSTIAWEALKHRGTELLSFSEAMMNEASTTKGFRLLSFMPPEHSRVWAVKERACTGINISWLIHVADFWRTRVYFRSTIPLDGARGIVAPTTLSAQGQIKSSVGRWDSKTHARSCIGRLGPLDFGPAEYSLFDKATGKSKDSFLGSMVVSYDKACDPSQVVRRVEREVDRSLWTYQ